MKKLFAFLLACSLLFLTACHQTTPNQTTSGNSQNQETPGGSQSQEKPSDSELKDTIIYNGTNEYLDIPSRFLFESGGTTYYYSKADGKAYIYCFDPLCAHEGGCLAKPKDYHRIFNFEVRCTFFINNRFYTLAPYGQIYSCAFDGSDLKIEYGQDSYTVEEVNLYKYLWSPNYRVYEQYIYIPMNADENGKPHTLRFNTETKEMEDLTEKMGNYIDPSFFYNGEIYGYDANHLWAKADLNLNKVESIETIPISRHFYGSLFFTGAYNIEEWTPDRKSIGLQSYDMKTGEKKVFTFEMLGLEEYVPTIVLVDENYIYFYQYKQIEIGTTTTPKGEVHKVYKNNDGKLYRVKHDGTECICIYDEPDFEITGSEAVICGDRFVISGRYAANRDGVVTRWDGGLKAGIIKEDGTIDKLENVEFVK